MPLDRPIPALYCCYLLRSTVRHSSLYIGSTPHPARRLRQHNGAAKGGAVKTSRDSLRPWEMAITVSGFPSSIAALQFEWAWQNPHVTRHIPDSLRITTATGKKKSGQPKRPPYSLVSVLSNLLLLLRVPSFSRWPLEVRFFSPDAHKSWVQIGSKSFQKLSRPLNVVLDFPTQPGVTITEDPQLPSVSRHFLPPDMVDKPQIPACRGIEAMPVTYAPYKSYIEKAKTIIDFEQQRTCGVCEQELDYGESIHVVCPNTICNSVSHLSCLSKTFLDEESRKKQGQENEGDGEPEQLVPISGTCRDCGQSVKWIDVVKEVTLRTRGVKQRERLLRKPTANGDTESKRKTAGKNISGESEVDDLDEEDAQDDICIVEDDTRSFMPADNGDQWYTINDSDDDLSSIATTNSVQASPHRINYWNKTELGTVPEDYDWSNALVLD